MEQEAVSTRTGAGRAMGTREEEAAGRRSCGCRNHSCRHHTEEECQSHLPGWEGPPCAVCSSSMCHSRHQSGQALLLVADPPHH